MEKVKYFLERKKAKLKAKMLPLSRLGNRNTPMNKIFSWF